MFLNQKEYYQSYHPSSRIQLKRYDFNNYK
mgnify:CR=1 FL=1